MQRTRKLGLLLSGVLVVLGMLPAPPVHADSLPGLTIGDAAVVEGNTGTVNEVFTVKLAYPSPNTVSVNYATSNSTAVAPSDYTAQSSSLVFSPGQTSKTISVPVNGDGVSENKETFSIQLSGVANASIADGTGIGTIVDDDPLPRLSIGDATVVEGNTGSTTNAVFTATLSNPSASVVKVRYATSNNTAVAPADYTAVNGTLTYQPGETSKTVTVPVIGDTVDEGAAERFNVTLSSIANAVLLRSTGIAVITDDDHDPQLTINDIRVLEGNSGTSNANFTVALNAPSPNPITVHYSTADGSAVGSSDYVPQNGTLSFAPGVTSQTIAVPVNGDTADEADLESFSTNLSGPVNAAIARTQGTAMILDDDPSLSFPAPRVSVIDTTVNEGSSGTSNAVFTVALTNPPTSTVSVNYATANNSAAAPADYAASSGTLTFNPADTVKTISVPVVPDTLAENDESFALNLSSPVGVVVQDGQAFATIVDDDVAPSLSINNTAVVENNSGTSNATLTVALSTTSPNPVTVNYATSDAGATAGTDYTSQAGSLSFAPGDTTKTIPVVIAGDTAKEPDENLTVALSNPTNATLLAGSGTVTIVNDDNDPGVSVDDVSVYEGNSGTANATFTVSVAPASPNPVTVNYATSDGSAKAGADYVAQSGQLTLPAGQTSKTVAIVVNGDTIDEGNESFSLVLSNPVNAAVVDSQGTGTVVDDDVNPRVSISDAAVVEGNSGTATANFNVYLSSASPNTVTVNYVTVDGSATGGIDYVSQSGAVSFAPGQTSKPVAIGVNGDTAIENDESFSVNLTAPVNAVTVDAQGMATIINDDSSPTLSIAGATTVEGAAAAQTPANFTVTLAPASPNTVTVHYATAGGSAIAGTDFVPVSGDLTFAPGETTKQVPVTVVGDTTDEANTESYTMTLTSPTNARLVTSQATGTIIDDDPALSPGSFLSISDAAVKEGNSGSANATFTVTLTPASTSAVTVRYNTADGAAAAGSDYLARTGTLTFTAGQTSQTVTVPVVGDTIDEQDEAFSVYLSSPVNATSVRASGTGTIIDDDISPRLWVSDATVIEGNGSPASATFALSMAPASPNQVTVDWQTGDGTAVSPDDYNGDFDTAVFNPGQTSQTVAITVNPDTLAEGTESFSLYLSGADDAALADSSAVGTILDQDTFALSGKVVDGTGTGLAGVTVTRTGNSLPAASLNTPNTGAYSFDVPDGSYTLTPTKTGYTFLPASIGVTVRGGSVGSRDFVAVHGVAITGRVLDPSGAALAGITIVRGTSTADVRVLTSALGYYAFSDTPAGSYQVSTSTAGYIASPLWFNTTVGATSVNGLDMIGCHTPAIIGQVTDANGKGVTGVTMTRSGNGQPAVTVTTNALGYFGFSNVPTDASGHSYTITPTKSGLTFTPASNSVFVSTGSYPIPNFSTP